MSVANTHTRVKETIMFTDPGEKWFVDCLKIKTHFLCFCLQNCELLQQKECVFVDVRYLCVFHQVDSSPETAIKLRNPPGCDDLSR